MFRTYTQAPPTPAIVHTTPSAQPAHQHVTLASSSSASSSNQGSSMIAASSSSSSGGWNPLTAFKSASTPTQAVAVVAGVAGLVGLGFLLRRSLANAAARRALEAAQMPAPQSCRYTQIRVEAGVGEGVADSYVAYQAAAKQARAAVPDANPWYVYVGASNSAETGTPWCSDCRRANPLVHAALERAALLASQPDSTVPGPIVVVTTFVDRAAYKDASNLHPLKTDKELHLPAVPTLFKFVHGAVIARLVEGECFDEAALDQFLQAPLPLHGAGPKEGQQ